MQPCHHLRRQRVRGQGPYRDLQPRVCAVLAGIIVCGGVGMCVGVGGGVSSLFVSPLVLVRALSRVARDAV